MNDSSFSSTPVLWHVLVGGNYWGQSQGLKRLVSESTKAAVQWYRVKVNQNPWEGSPTLDDAVQRVWQMVLELASEQGHYGFVTEKEVWQIARAWAIVQPRELTSAIVSGAFTWSVG